MGKSVACDFGSHDLTPGSFFPLPVSLAKSSSVKLYHLCNPVFFLVILKTIDGCEEDKLYGRL